MKLTDIDSNTYQFAVAFPVFGCNSGAIGLIQGGKYGRNRQKCPPKMPLRGNYTTI
jgi:hypothetical protein